MSWWRRLYVTEDGLWLIDCACVIMSQKTLLLCEWQLALSYGLSVRVLPCTCSPAFSTSVFIVDDRILLNSWKLPEADSSVVSLYKFQTNQPCGEFLLRAKTQFWLKPDSVNCLYHNNRTRYYVTTVCDMSRCGRSCHELVNLLPSVVFFVVVSQYIQTNFRVIPWSKQRPPHSDFPYISCLITF